MKGNTQASLEDRLPEDEVLAQMSYVEWCMFVIHITQPIHRTLVIAATDTTSSALARILDLLSQHPDIQERLRNEITEARNGQDISYDHLVDLPYLDAVCRETLRL